MVLDLVVSDRFGQGVKNTNMPHDLKGNLLQVGDKVNIPATVTAIQAGEEYCNLSVEFDHSMPPYTTKMAGTFNTKQVEKVSS